MSLFKRWYITADKKIDKYSIYIKDNYNISYIYLTEESKNKFIDNIKSQKDEYLCFKDEFNSKECIFRRESIKYVEIDQQKEYFISDTRYKTREEAEQASKNLDNEWFNVKVNKEGLIWQ